MTELLEFWMEWRFSGPMPGGGTEEDEAAILDRFKNGDPFPITDPVTGVLRGMVAPSLVELSNDGSVMRVRFDLADVVLADG